MVSIPQLEAQGSGGPSRRKRRRREIFLEPVLTDKSSRPWKLNSGYMKQLKLKAERRFFGGRSVDSSETERMSATRASLYTDSDNTTPLDFPLYNMSESSGNNGLPSTTSATSATSVTSNTNNVNMFPTTSTSTLSEQLRATLQSEQREGHQRSESTCNLLDYEEHIMRRDMTRRQGEMEIKDGEGEEDQLPVIAFMLTSLRRSLMTCTTIDEGSVSNGMDISWPTNVRHVTHVTFDRFNGFLGLPVEFEVEIPRRAPSASANVFGVSPESMQCSYDSRGNSVPTILLRMQDRLYSLGGLKAEGIFRINAENSHEEHVRDQLNKGIVPFHIDLHCLAGLIKAWFRELPSGVLDTLSPEQVMQCHSEEQSVALVKLLPPMQAALLDWAINLMADVAQDESVNKMNARNVAMVFAPNMTQMADPLTALMHAVQVMNLLKTLILRTIRDRQEMVLDSGPSVTLRPPRNDASDSTPLLIKEREDVKVEYEDYGHCARSHSKQTNTKARGTNRLVNRIDQHIERVEAW